MPDIKSIIQSHNRNVIEKTTTTPEKACNCRKDTCPLGGTCLTECVIYEAKVSKDTSDKFYIGSTGRSFKDRYGSHKYSFQRRGKSETELSKYIWSLKNNGVTHNISWKILKQFRRAKPSARGACSLCNAEKITIANADKRNLLNSRSELNNMCPHYKGLYFKRIKKK